MVRVNRTANVLRPAQSRVLLRPFSHGDSQRVGQIMARIMAIPEEQVGPLLEEISSEFAHRHRGIQGLFLERYEQVAEALRPGIHCSEQRRLLIGSYFLAEYSLECAALFNPSIVPHMDQAGLAFGALRFILTLRATGEGHISSITFRTGVVHPDQRIEVSPPGTFVTEPRRIPGLTDEFEFQPDRELSERVLFPATLSQRNGIEDARFVRFRNEDGSEVYFATFTAYDGRTVRPELLETTDFVRFRFATLTGSAARNKGMALFPRKINGRYAMLSRQDAESIHLAYSDDLHSWEEHKLLLRPCFAWELVQVGNCGSPIETDAGWLVLTHGVGPMRKYCISAFLLDRNDPGKVIGRLRDPLLEPMESERDGYVPNVVYTCGAILHRGELIIPHGLADHTTGFSTVSVDAVLAAMGSEEAIPGPG